MMQDKTDAHMRRRSPAYSALAGPEGAISSSDSGQGAAGGMFHFLYNSLGGWLIESPPQDVPRGSTAEPAQSLPQVLEHVANWALRATMLNTSMCVPTSMWATPDSSRSHSPSDAAAAAADASAAAAAAAANPMRPPSSCTSRDLAAAASAAAGQGGTGRDVCKGAAAGQDTGKQLAGASSKALGTNGISTDQQQRPAPRQAAAAPGSEAAAAAGPDAPGNPHNANSSAPPLEAEVERLRREVSCLRTSLGTLYLTCSSLKEENQRLRCGDGGEELLSDALQQLLGEKSALQQEVSRLRRQNQALQELLDYTAAAAAPPSASEGTWGCCEGSGMTAAAAAGECAAAAGAGYSGAAGLYGLQQGQEQQRQCCGYWLATPAASTASRAPSVAASGRGSPGGSSTADTADWQGSAVLATAAEVLAVAAAAVGAAAKQSIEAAADSQAEADTVTAALAQLELSGSEEGEDAAWDAAEGLLDWGAESSSALLPSVVGLGSSRSGSSSSIVQQASSAAAQ